jgi:hypothetical protein
VEGDYEIISTNKSGLWALDSKEKLPKVWLSEAKVVVHAY